MKKFNLIAVILLFMVVGAKAQDQTTASTNVNVELNDVMSIAVNNSNVLLRFVNSADYLNGVSTPQPAHLTVTSNKAYTINVKATGNLSGTGSNNDILDAGVVAVSIPSDGTNNGSLGGTLTPVNALTTGDNTLITAATPVTAKNIDVLYTVPSSVSTTNKILGKTADTYTTVVTYTISQ